MNLTLAPLLAEAGIDVERDGVQIGPVPGTGEASVSFGVTAARALELGLLDGFWANGMGAEVAVQRGVGTIVLDVRRGEGPPAAQQYTFSAMVTTDTRIEREPESVAAAIRALVKAQRALSRGPNAGYGGRQTPVPARQADLIAELIRRDLPYYDPVISEDVVARLNRFSQDIGLLSAPAPYERGSRDALQPSLDGMSVGRLRSANCRRAG